MDWVFDQHQEPRRMLTFLIVMHSVSMACNNEFEFIMLCLSTEGMPIVVLQ